MVIRLPRRLRRSPRGQGLVEFAIILPFLMLVLLLGIDFGRVFFGWVGLANASRIGASFAAAHPDAWGTPGDATERDSYLDQILADANALNCTLPGTIPDPVFANGTDMGDPAQVTLSCDFSLITPVVSQLLGGTITIQADSIFPVRTGMIAGIPVGGELPDPSLPAGQLCDAPVFIGERVNTAQADWSAAGFAIPLIITRPPSGNYVIIRQEPAVGGQPVDCQTTVMTVYGN